MPYGYDPEEDEQFLDGMQGPQDIADGVLAGYVRTARSEQLPTIGGLSVSPPPSKEGELAALQAIKAQPYKPTGGMRRPDTELLDAQAADKQQNGWDKFSEALYAAGMRQAPKYSNSARGVSDLLQRRGAQAGQAKSESDQERQGLLNRLTQAQIDAKGRGENPGDDDYKRAMAERLRALAARETATVEAKTGAAETADAELEVDRRILGKIVGEDLSGMSRKGIDSAMRQLNISERDKARLRERAAAIEAARAKAASGAEAKAKADAAKAERGDMKMTDDLRKEFNGLPWVRTYKEIEGAFGKVKTSSQENNASGDLALIYAYMRLLDPGSAVKEGEFANAEKAGGMLDKAKVWTSKIEDGERLTPEMRARFVSSALRLYDEHKKQEESEVAKYRGLATKRGLNADDVAGGSAAPSSPPPGAVKALRNKSTGQVKYLDANGQELK